MLILAMLLLLSFTYAQGYGEFLESESGVPVTITEEDDACTDGVFDIFNGETDTDCGGKTCDRCEVEQKCFVHADCDSRLCKCVEEPVCEDENGCPNLICTKRECFDRFADLLCTNARLDEDNEETDVDCGGTLCSKCRMGDECKEDSDCKEGLCEGDVCVSDQVSELCNNDQLDNETLETDVDCGGECKLCGIGSFCLDNSDCDSNNCAESICQEAEEESEEEQEPVTETPAEIFESQSEEPEENATAGYDFVEEEVDVFLDEGEVKVVINEKEYTMLLKDVMFSSRHETDVCAIEVNEELFIVPKDEYVLANGIFINPVLVSTKGALGCRVNVYSSNYGVYKYNKESFTEKTREELLELFWQDKTSTKEVDKEYHITLLDAIKTEDPSKSSCKFTIGDESHDVKLGSLISFSNRYLGVADVLTSYRPEQDSDACELGYIWEDQEVTLPRHEFLKTEPKPKQEADDLSCDDTTDNNFYTKNEIKLNTKTYTDMCAKKILKDFFCSNGELRSVYFECPKSCSQGACEEITLGNTLSSSSYVTHTTSNIVRMKWLKSRLLIELEGESNIDGILTMKTKESPEGIRIDNKVIEQNTDWIWNNIDSELTIYYTHSKHTIIISFEEEQAPVVERPQPPKTEPEPVQPQPEPVEAGFDMSLLKWIIAGVLAIFLLMGFVLVKAYHPGASANAQQTMQKMAQQHQVHEFNPQIEKLKDFIRSSLAKGFNPQQINDALFKMGWSNDLIAEAFNEIREESQLNQQRR
ncbi:hypothetical protein HN419_01060 [Candidatus Woesearchaeota archaeon]|nr:hypothetical protein [Candidatus Woesearchaeota archaeon]MBT4717527.1 hypothetical protein [Candidatus Woesearchaeota archaeon]MBT7106277.1 hypothetical protein [Candidatus Woesearchaeota archaeon]MBT7930825.1 hypothetical protein [Candidatus Woesearchaeota archaeon]